MSIGAWETRLDWDSWTRDRQQTSIVVLHLLESAKDWILCSMDSDTSRLDLPAPTINDLRVKLCYICREEENAELPNPTPKPRAWTHPCKCTLVAHEDCLLKWIQSSQSNTSRAPNALKCPQCNTSYRIESREPALLKVLAVGNKILQRCGTYFTLFGVASAVGIAGTSVYICMTAYGAYALEKFIGPEMFNLVLTDDPINWPWAAYINLPLIPISLILSRFHKSSSSSSLVIPLLLSWPSAPPVGEPARKLYEFWGRPENAERLTRFSFLNSTSKSEMWPPPPVLFALFGVPMIKALYRNVYAWTYYKVLKVPLPVIGNTRNGVRLNNGPVVIRILADVDGGVGGDAPNGPGGQQNDQGHRPDGQGDAQQPNAPAGGEADPEAGAVQAAEQLIEINATSLGRKIGGALLIPVISNMMGSLLFKLAKRSHLLRMFLGIRDQRHRPRGQNWISALLVGGPGSRLPSSDRYINSEFPQPPLSWRRLVGLPSLSYFGDQRKEWKNLSRFEQMNVGLGLVMNAVLGTSKMWVESDPVWWRNCVGFAVFVAVKDAIHLLHLWLKKRELESRRVKDRDFSGIDIRELDLLPSFFLRTVRV